DREPDPPHGSPRWGWLAGSLADRPIRTADRNRCSARAAGRRPRAWLSPDAQLTTADALSFTCHRSVGRSSFGEKEMATPPFAHPKAEEARAPRKSKISGPIQEEMPCCWENFALS